MKFGEGADLCCRKKGEHKLYALMLLACTLPSGDHTTCYVCDLQSTPKIFVHVQPDINIAIMTF